MTRTAFLGALIVLAAGCHKDADYDAWQHLLDQVDDEGRMSLDVARAAFSLAIAPLPGVESPAGRRRLIPCGKPAVDEMIAHYDELTDDQRAVFLANTRPVGSTKSDRDRLRTTTISDASPTYKGWVLEAKQRYLLETKTPDFPIEVYESDVLQPDFKEEAAAQALGFDSDGMAVGPMTKCVIVLYPPISALGQASQKEAVYHEVFHCVQASMYPSVKREVASPGWIKEGGAEWAATTVLNQALLSQNAWADYALQGSKSLYQRFNDALGFFAQLEHDDRKPFIRMPDIITGWSNGDSERALQEAVAGDPDFFSRWATSYLRKFSLGPEWDMYGVGLPAFPVEETILPVTDEIVHEDLVAPASNQWYRLEISSQVVRLRVPAGARLRQVEGDFDTTMPFGDWCTEPDGCKCPEDSPFAFETLPPLPKGNYYLTLPGRFKGAPFSVSGAKTEQHCKRDIIDPCLVGTWRLNSASVIGPNNTLCAWPKPLGAIVNITSAGVYTVDVSPIETVSCKGSAMSPAYEMRFEGSSTGVFAFADHGYAAGSGDLSGLLVEVLVGGMSAGKMAFATVFGADVLVGAGTANYTCSKSSLSITTDLNVNTYDKL